MRTPKILSLALAATLLLCTAPLLASTDGLWLHVRVEEKGGEASNVSVNLPLNVVEKAIPMIPQDVIGEHGLQIEDQEITVQQLRELWTELAREDDMTLATVEGNSENVLVAKRGGYLVVTVDESSEEGDAAQVNVRIPASVVDALLSGEGEHLDIVAALRALAAHGEGELVTVVEKDSSVRVWVDAIAEAR